MKQLITKNLAIIAILLCSWQTLLAQTPQYFVGTNAGGNTIPFNSATYSSGRYQSLYLAGEFISAPSGMYITKIYFRNSTAVTSLTFTNFEIYIGQNTTTGLVNTAWQTGLTLAFSSPSFVAGPYAIGSWIPITLTTPILYNPAQSLIIDTRHTATSGGFSVRTTTPGGNRRCYAAGSTAISPTAASTTCYDFGFDLTASNTPMLYDSSEVFNPNVNNSVAGQKNVPFLGLKVYASGAQNKLRFTSFNYNYLGTSNLDVSSMRLWHTGASSNFDTTKQIGATVSAIGSSFNITSTGFDSLAVGTNYFWLTGNVEQTATLCNTLDFENANVTIGDTLRTPLVTNPVGVKQIRPPLSGTYTIGAIAPTTCNGTHFASFTDAVKDLNELGITGAVTFLVDTGTFVERITINPIKGVSAINKITFIGSGKNTTKLTHNSASSVGASTVWLNGADHIHFRDMTIEALNNTYGIGVLLNNIADSNSFRNMIVNLSLTSTVATTGGIIFSGTEADLTLAGNNGNYCTMDSVDINGGYYGIVMYGLSSTVLLTGNKITNCKFNTQYYYATYLYYNNRFLMRGNVNDGGRNTTYYALYNYYGSNYSIEQNQFNSPSVGVYLVNTNDYLYDNAVNTYFVNNLVKGGSSYAIYFNSCSNTKIWHNTFVSSITSTTSGTAYFTGNTTPDVDCRNNIIVNQSLTTGNAVYNATSNVFSHLDYNNYIAPGNIMYTSATVLYATLAAWKSAVPTQNINSISTSPVFVSATNIHIQQTNPTMTAPNLGFNVDVDGDSRFSPTTIGADERPLPHNNAGIQALISPTNFCAGTHDIKVNVVNEGVNQITGVTLNWELNGMLQTPITWPGTIDTLGSVAGNDTVLTVGTALFGAGVNTTLKIWTSFPNSVTDTANNNDTITRIVRPGLAAGNYTVGSGGTYTNLTAAFADLNFGACGPIILELQSNYTSAGETFPLVVSASGTATNTVLIRPQGGATALTITSNNATATLDFNGADYITIDGRPGGFGNKELTITNTAATGAAIRFINGASYNQLKHLEARASNTTITSGAVFFSTATDTTANSYNTIDNCNINGNSATLNCIYSSGSAAPSDNKGNIVTNSNIYDFFTNVASGTANGILLEAGNNNWQIGALGNGNNFYQTAIRNSTSSPALTNAVGFRAVQLNNATINGTSIIGNRIGGSIPGIASSVFVIGDAIAATTPSHFIRAIDLVLAGTTTPTSIQGNTISDITLYTGVSAGFAGIHALSGVVNTGNVTGNTIGATSGTGSINLFYKNASTGINLYGIRYSSGATGLIQNNRIGSITADAAAGSAQLLCVYVSNAVTTPLTIANNTIGSLITPHSIQAAATSIAPINVMGLCASAASGSVITFENNVVSNLSQLNALATTTNGLKGIYITGASAVGTVITGNQVNRLYSVSTNTAIDQSSAIIGINTTSSGAGTQTISNNTVHTLVSATPSAAVTVHGIYVGSTTTSNDNIIKSNTINKLAANTANQLATINGITLGTAVTSRVSVVNNMISLGYDSSDNAYTGTVAIHGILKTGALGSMYHNTVKVDGAGVGSAVFNTYAYRTTTSTLDTLMNNMFINTRSNASTGGTHYAISLPNAVNLTTNYNLYHATGAIGLFNSANQNALADWKASTTQDANSVQTSVNFISNTDLHLNTGSIGNVVLAGTPIAHVSTDFDNQNRSTSYPYMGADENSTPVPVTLTTFTATATGGDVLATWTTASEINASHFNVEASVDGVNYRVVGNVKARGNSTINSNYSFTHKDAPRVMNASTIYYRLVSVDVDRTSSTSRRVLVNFNARTSTIQNTVAYPNPFTDKLHLAISTEMAGDVSIAVYDMRGQLIHNQTNSLINGTNTIEVNSTQAWQKGIYFMRITSANETKIIKLVKE